MINHLKTAVSVTLFAPGVLMGLILAYAFPSLFGNVEGGFALSLIIGIPCGFALAIYLAVMFGAWGILSYMALSLICFGICHAILS